MFGFALAAGVKTAIWVAAGVIVLFAGLHFATHKTSVSAQQPAAQAQYTTH
jgi:hypothetical protein